MNPDLASGTVCNDLQLGNRIVILTGANSSGKSSLMRAAIATVLLANVGLPVPCAAASVPRYASFFYRSFDGDSPLSGRSGHARECFEIQQLFRLAAPFDSARPHFVCIDELGKGTEDLSATALCSAALEFMDAVRALRSPLGPQAEAGGWNADTAGPTAPVTLSFEKLAHVRMQMNYCGIFATHQHDLVSSELGLLPELDRCFVQQMDTYRASPGISTESTALRVAEREGLAGEVVHDAECVLTALPPGLQPHAAALGEPAETS